MRVKKKKLDTAVQLSTKHRLPAFSAGPKLLPLQKIIKQLHAEQGDTSIEQRLPFTAAPWDDISDKIIIQPNHAKAIQEHHDIINDLQGRLIIYADASTKAGHVGAAAVEFGHAGV